MVKAVGRRAGISDIQSLVAELVEADSFSLGSDGPATSFADIGGGSGEWTEDGNSPVTGQTGIGSYTYTPATTYDMYKVTIEWDAVSSNVNLSLQINGDTGSNYSNISYSGSEASGNTDAGTLDFASGEDNTRTILRFQGRWGDRGWSGQNLLQNAGNTASFRPQNPSVSSPLSQFTILFNGGTNEDLNTLEVKGRDI